MFNISNKEQVLTVTAKQLDLTGGEMKKLILTGGSLLGATSICRTHYLRTDRMYIKQIIMLIITSLAISSIQAKPKKTRYIAPPAVDPVVLAEQTLAYVQKSATVPQLAAKLNAAIAEYRKSPSDKSLKKIKDLRRTILFSHPDLQFDDLLFNKRQAFQMGQHHMIDHYLGINAKPGDGLAVLKDWKRSPKEQLLIKDKLPIGTSTHPDLSFDGKKILFAFAAANKDKWQQRYAIYEIDVDGSNLRQITGQENDKQSLKYGRKTQFIEDWDPCYLPDGGIAFISSRIQGHVRCAYGVRYCPTFGLYRMESDGTKIRQLSYGDIGEYDPVVLPDGRICYTRWEYINRHDTYFQGLWTINPDGTQTAHYYGNYTRSPNVVVQAQPIPGTRKVMALATAHHASYKGSVITIDTTKGEDGAAPLTRMTPEVPFPETDEGSTHVGRYSDPYPINDTLFFAAYLVDKDPKFKDKGRWAFLKNRRLDIYLCDRFGGRELIYSAPDGQSCFSPIPLQARNKPPVRPSILPTNPKTQTGVLTISDVYQSRHAIKKGSVKYIRVNQLYDQPAQVAPKLSIVHGHVPAKILGEVPVNEDGSVSFEAPAGEPLQLQLLDKNRMCIMNMRTFIYLQPGEVSSCVGCHEDRKSTPPVRRLTDIKVHTLTPPKSSDYSGGFSFMKSVQPVLDRHCIKCHGLDKIEKNVNLVGSYLKLKNPIYGPTKHVDSSQSYSALIKYNKIAYRNKETDMSALKDYCSHQSKLPGIIKKHKGVKLSDDEWHAIISWLDHNSPLYGDWSWNKDEYRNLDQAKVKELRAYIALTLGDTISKQPIDALINIGDISKSRILNAPLTKSAGGWGQINSWDSIEDPGYKKMKRLVESCIIPHKYQDVDGTCGRGSDNGCLCYACWTRERIESGKKTNQQKIKMWPVPRRE